MVYNLMIWVIHVFTCQSSNTTLGHYFVDFCVGKMSNLIGDLKPIEGGEGDATTGSTMQHIGVVTVAKQGAGADTLQQAVAESGIQGSSTPSVIDISNPGWLVDFYELVETNHGSHQISPTESELKVWSRFKDTSASVLDPLGQTIEDQLLR